MPHRSAEIRELCQAIVPAGNELATCKAKTDDGCPRCGMPLCAAHTPPASMRCRDCEAEYAVRIRENMGRYVLMAALPLGGIGALMVAIAFFAGSVVAVLPVAALAATSVVVLMSPIVFERVFGRALPRRTFLRERKK